MRRECCSVKLLYVTSSLPYGPGEAFIIPEIQEMIRCGHEVMIVPMFPRGQVVHEDAEALLRYTLTEKLVSLGILCGALAELLRHPRDVGRGIRSAIAGLPKRTASKNLVAYARGLWLGRVARDWGAAHIHAHWLATTATMALVASRVSGIPWSCTAHRWDIVENNLLQDKMRDAVFVRFISESGLEVARRLAGNIAVDKGTVLHMGIQVPEHLEIPRPRRDGHPVVLCPAKLSRVKGHHYLIEAFDLLRERGVCAELWLAGAGEMRNAIEAQIRELGLENQVKLLGHLSHGRLIRLYQERQVDVVVLPSIDLGSGVHEGIPVALMEAMGYGVPVVSTSTGGIPELLGEGAGVLVSQRDALALAEALGMLLTDAGLRQSVGHQGRLRVLTDFDVRKIAAELCDRFVAG
jgi:colanic acid/amylovoran biosynthesis glycosyltransferase